MVKFVIVILGLKMGIFEIKFGMGVEIGMFWFEMGVVFGELDGIFIKIFYILFFGKYLL